VHRALSSVVLRAVVIDGTQDQLWSISEELRRDYGVEVTGVDVDEIRPGDGDSGALLGANLVVTTAYHVRDANRIASRLGVHVYMLSTCTDVFTEAGRLLERGPVYFVVTDPRYAARLRRIFENDPGAARLAVLVHGRDELDAIPPGAPLYITGLTRRRMVGSPLLERGIPEARVFTRASAAEIMSFVVRANLGPRPGAG
jgi:hypothetical protein